MAPRIRTLEELRAIVGEDGKDWTDEQLLAAEQHAQQRAYLTVAAWMDRKRSGSPRHRTENLVSLKGRLVLLLVLAAVVAGTAPLWATQYPPALSVDHLVAQVEVSGDLRTMTLRGLLSDDITICIEPKAGVFGPRRCARLGDLRAGKAFAQPGGGR